MVRFGETAEQFSARVTEMDGDVWIKGFKEGGTRVRFLQPTGTWITYREHYSEGPGYFPCSEDTQTCPGCTDSSERVQKRSRRYAMNCLGESGRVDVHKVGSRLYKTLKSREQRLETILDRDYTITRIGKGLDTDYDLDPGDKYALDNPEELVLHDIGEILAAKYREACEAYGIEVEGDEGEPDADPDIEAAARVAMAKESKPSKAKPKSEPVEEPAQADSQDDVLKHLHSGFIKVEDADTDDLKAFAKDKGIDLPPRAPRGRIEKLVSTWINDNPPF